MINQQITQELINELDKSNVYQSIQNLPDQISDAYTAVRLINVRSATDKINLVVVAGMGGSALGARVVNSVWKDALLVPMEIVNDYYLPNYIDQHTLVILSSYSGNTEETISAYRQASDHKCQLAFITAGGKLAEIASITNSTVYLIRPSYNPSNQPRMAIGYAIMGLVGLLQNFGLLNIENDWDILALTNWLREFNHKWGVQVENNLAINLANELSDKIIYLISAGHLTGSTHVFNNQINENAKQLTVELVLPELNHHYMEALINPKKAKDICHFCLINSPLYAKPLQIRVKLTKEIILKNGYGCSEVMLTGGNNIYQAFELIQFGAYVNFYLAMGANINPAPIPWVDYFKEQLIKEV